MNLVTLLISWGVPAKIAKPLLIVATVILACLAAWAVVKIHDHRVIKDHEVKVQQRAAPATDQAATERASDTIAQAKNEQEMHNVIAAQPDRPIAPTSHALACQRLRAAGRNPPACR